MNLQQHYVQNIVLGLKDKFGNRYAVPRLVKLTLNMGIKELLAKNKGALDIIQEEIFKITGQKPLVVRVKKSCDGFSIKKGDINAIKVTIRGKHMYNFLEKIVFFILPRLRDFSGFSKSAMDGRGNFSFGITDCSAFYEIDKKNIPFIFGFNITITTNAKSNDDGILLLTELGLPFVN